MYIIDVYPSSTESVFVSQLELVLLLLLDLMVVLLNDRCMSGTKASTGKKENTHRHTIERTPTVSTTYRTSTFPCLLLIRPDAIFSHKNQTLIV